MTNDSPNQLDHLDLLSGLMRRFAETETLLQVSNGHFLMCLKHYLQRLVVYFFASC